MRDAKVFLMDEPLSNLDAKLRVTMRSEISKLHHRLQTTTIYVTHDQTEAMTMATRLVVMKDGRIQQVGTPKEVYEYPENVFVGGFIGSPAMNFFAGKLENGKFVLDHIKLSIPEKKLEVLREKGYENKNIILGIRPEHIYDNPSMLETLPDYIINIKIEVAELLGAESMIYATLHNQSFIARLDTRNDYQTGEVIQLVFNMNKVHFFDAETQLRIK